MPLPNCCPTKKTHDSKSELDVRSNMALRNSRRHLPVISLFSGALGLDLGLEAAGFQIRVAVECDKHAAATIRRNRPDIPVIERPIEEVTVAEILRVAGLQVGEPTLVTGGPSCQAFS